MVWFEGDKICVDGSVYADYRGMPEEIGRAEIEADIERFLGRVEIRWPEDDLPF